jgi:hypothetical protein
VVRSFPASRTCQAAGCATQLSRHNPARHCSVHRGWDRQTIHRPRRKAKVDPESEPGV